MSRVKVPLLVAPPFVIVLLAAIGPWLAPHRVDEPVTRPFAGPSREAPLGGDILGRDVFSQVLNGGWGLILLALVIAALVTSISAVLGTAAALRPRIGRVIELSADMLILLPPVLGILVVMLAWPESREFGLVIIAVTLGAPYCARVFAAAAAGVAASGYIQVAAASGERLPYMIFREALPNLRSTLLAQFGLRFVNGMELVAVAAFLQLSTALGASNWGVMIRDNTSGIVLNPWAVVAPSLAIGLVAVSVSLATSILETGTEVTHDAPVG
jgi:peptide/nickel transport system permease protein